MLFSQEAQHRYFTKREISSSYFTKIVFEDKIQPLTVVRCIVADFLGHSHTTSHGSPSVYASMMTLSAPVLAARAKVS